MIPVISQMRETQFLPSFLQKKKKKTCKELEQAPIGGKGAFNPIPHLSFNFSLILF